MGQRRYYYYRSDAFVHERIPVVCHPRVAEEEMNYTGHYCGSCMWYERNRCNKHRRDEDYVGHACDNYKNGYEGAVEEVNEEEKGFVSIVINENYVYGVQ